MDQNTCTVHLSTSNADSAGGKDNCTMQSDKALTSIAQGNTISAKGQGPEGFAFLRFGVAIRC